jgi:hypothetical protein
MNMDSHNSDVTVESRKEATDEEYPIVMTTAVLRQNKVICEPRGLHIFKYL